MSIPPPPSSPFCRECIRNQQIQINLIANYDDSDNPQQVENYRISLDSRFPILCESCQPAVSEIIAARDYMAKAAALGGRLRATKQRRVEEDQARGRSESWHYFLMGVAWRIRGIAWWITSLGSIAWPVSELLSTPQPLPSRWYIVGVVMSIFWTFWDPTWKQARSERNRGRTIEFRYKAHYIATQTLAFLLRLVISLALLFGVVRDLRALCWISLPIFIISTMSYRLPRAKTPSVRLPSSSQPILASPSTPPEEILLDSLSLSPYKRRPPSTPTILPTLRNRFTPIRTTPPPTSRFGEPSFPIPVMPHSSHAEVELQSMDWTPSAAQIQLREQSFFAPVKPTGLESTISALSIDIEREGKLEGTKKSRWKFWSSSS